MEYANLSSFERLSGKAIFTPTGQSGGIDLGNIQMIKNTLNAKTVEMMLSQRGHQVLARKDTSSVAPVFEIDGDQFASPTLALSLLGTQNADISQSSATGSTFAFTAQHGQSFQVGKFNLSNVVVTVASVAKTLGVDYFVDLFNGIISLPVVAAGIADAASVTVTYNCAACTLEDWTAFTVLNRQGTMVIYAEDEYGPPAKEIWTFQAQLSVKTGADIDPTKFRKFTLECSVFGNPDVQKRKN